jgi:hypothetical protein
LRQDGGWLFTGRLACALSGHESLGARHGARQFSFGTRAVPVMAALKSRAAAPTDGPRSYLPCLAVISPKQKGIRKTIGLKGCDLPLDRDFAEWPAWPLF